MTTVDEFLATVMPRLKAADTALHSGDASQRIALWSHTEPVTLFGAAVASIGWNDVNATFQWLQSRFTNCTSFDYEVKAAGVSGDLAYVVGVEHTTASVAGGPPGRYALRVTTIFRRETGEWKVVHRHANTEDSGSDAQLARLSTPAQSG